MTSMECSSSSRVVRIAILGVLALAHVGVLLWLPGRPQRSAVKEGPLPALEVTILADRALVPISLHTEPLLMTVLVPPIDPPSAVFDAPEETHRAPIGQVIDRRARIRPGHCRELRGNLQFPECLRALR
jgi:hypothetical protein